MEFFALKYFYAFIVGSAGSLFLRQLFFSYGGDSEYSWFATHGLLFVVASFIVEHGLGCSEACGIS